MKMLNENKEVYNIGFERKLEESEKLDLNLGKIMRNIYNLNVIAWRISISWNIYNSISIFFACFIDNYFNIGFSWFE